MWWSHAKITHRFQLHKDQQAPKGMCARLPCIYVHVGEKQEITSQNNLNKTVKTDHLPFSKLRFLQTSSSAIWDCAHKIPPCVLDIIFTSCFWVKCRQSVSDCSFSSWSTEARHIKQTYTSNDGRKKRTRTHTDAPLLSV